MKRRATRRRARNRKLVSRVWSKARKVTIEAHALCRGRNGQWIRKGGDEPRAALIVR